jgi:hypothetical protein
MLGSNSSSFFDIVGTELRELWMRYVAVPWLGTV